MVRGACALAPLAALLVSGGAPAEETDGVPAVPLEQLLRVPDESVGTPPPVERGGATRAEWRDRFDSARADLDHAERALEASQRELEELAGETSDWQVTAPGAGSVGGDAPLSYRLRQQIRRHREDVERAERRLRELRVEASLAGVPEEWTGSESQAARPAQP